MNTFRPFDKTLCTFCGGDSFIVGMLPTQISLECVSCHVFQYPLFPQQEPAVQVPATAPAAGHLSTQPSDTRLDVDPLAPSDCIFAQCSKCTSKFFAPAVAFGHLLLVCENCETGFAFSDPVNTWPQADQCHIPDLSTEIVNK